MKKTIIIVLLIIVSVAICQAIPLYPRFFSFGGRWQPSEDPVLIEGDGFVDIQNLRRINKRLKGVSGHTRITTTPISDNTSTYKNAFHYKKSSPAETHILTQWEASGGSGIVEINDTAIPNAGNYEASSWFTEDADGGLGRFSEAPGNSVIYTNGVDTKIWSGDETGVAAFYFVSSDNWPSLGAEDARDYTDEVNTATETGVAAVEASGYMLVGTTRPIQGIKFYISSGNASAATMVGKYYKGSSVLTTLTITDGTSGLDSTGWVTFDSTVDTAEKWLIQNTSLYWYQFEIDAGSADIYYVTVDMPVQNIKNIWDGVTVPLAACLKFVNSTSQYIDYTDEANDDTDTNVVVLDSHGTSDYLYLGFVERQQGFFIDIPEGKGNTNSALMSVKYWNGTAWTLAPSQDYTDCDSGETLECDGLIPIYASWVVNEQPYSFDDKIPLYYYQLSWNAALDAETEIAHIEGVPNPQPVGDSFNFSQIFQNRLFLFRENYALYSAFDSSDIFNGSDSDTIYLGESKDLTAACVVSNIYDSSAIYMMLVTNPGETYRLLGNGPDNWEVQKISGTVGCPAPLSMAVCDVSGVGEAGRHVAIWQSGAGVILTDGASLQDISRDIYCYFDKNDSRAIPQDRIDDSVGWFDPKLNVYKLLISSGSGQTTHNVELEYSLLYGEWTKIYREDGSGANPLQIGFPVSDTYGNDYNYGMTTEGHLYRLENGNTWNGTAIEQSITTKDIMLAENGFWNHTHIEYFRSAFKTKSTGDGEDFSFTHYCDQAETTDGSNLQEVPADIDLANGPYATSDCYLGPCLYHRFKLTGSTSTVADGLELSGMGFYYTFEDTIFED